MSCTIMAQDNGRTLKPNYRKIARVVKSPSSPYYLDSLEERFSRCDTTLTVDDLRCLYYGGTANMLTASHKALDAAVLRFGMASRRAGIMWWRYQMLTTAVWSTGDGSKRKPTMPCGWPPTSVPPCGSKSKVSVSSTQLHNRDAFAA